jgi:hypothetical protein
MQAVLVRLYVTLGGGFSAAQLRIQDAFITDEFGQMHVLQSK